jgi:hypothetical protein
MLQLYAAGRASAIDHAERAAESEEDVADSIDHCSSHLITACWYSARREDGVDTQNMHHGCDQYSTQ